MPKKTEKNAADLERIARDKISQIRRVVLDDSLRSGSPIKSAGTRSHEIETVVLESLRVRKALMRILRKAGREK